MMVSPMPLSLVPAAPSVDLAPNQAPRPGVATGYTYDGHRMGAWQGLDEDEKTPELVWPNSIDVYDQMRRSDPQVGAVLLAVTLPIIRTNWRLSPNGARPEVVEHVSDDLGVPILGQEDRTVLRTRDRFSFQELLNHALLCLPFGHSYFEQTYRYDGNLQRLHRLGWIPSRSIKHLEVGSNGMLQWLEQNRRVGASRDEVPIPIRRLVAYVHKREGGNWLGQSLLRPAYKPWLLKESAQRIQELTTARNGLGIPDYEAPEVPATVTNADDRRRLEQAAIDNGTSIVANLRAGRTAGVSRPGGSELTLRGVTGTLPDIDRQIKSHNEEIARAVLAGFLTLGGDNSTGSYALGDTFLNFFVDSLQVTAESFRDVTNQHIIEDLVDINYGESEPAPRLVFDEIGSNHPATAQALKMLVDARILSPDEPLERATRTTYGLPAADPATVRPWPKAGSEPAAPDSSGAPA